MEAVNRPALTKTKFFPVESSKSVPDSEFIQVGPGIGVAHRIPDEPRFRASLDRSHRSTVNVTS
jgi:hypothetical protein